jgi:ABC-type lipoprotein export system ATPase subunit
MPSIDLAVESQLSQSARARQLEAMFDVPSAEAVRLTWKGELPIDERDWSVGLIVGPSGSGKSTILRSVFGAMPSLIWGKPSVVDDFDNTLAMKEIAAACQAVGFNTIPAWLRPHAVLSNGEQFRVDLARRILEIEGTIVVDEFTSVVDRQVAQIGAHAVQKAVRRNGKQFVAASCHYDIVEWLQPDWVLEPATMTFQWRSVQRRPAVAVELRRVGIRTWDLFAPFHYLTRELHRSAACWCLFIEGRPTAFAGVLHRPHRARHDIKGVSRLVTLPDWQGLGLALALVDKLGGLYRAAGLELRTYPAHPALIRSFDHSTVWKLESKPGLKGNVSRSALGQGGTMGGRPNAVFSYCGEASTKDEAAAAGLTSAAEAAA